MVVTGWGSGTDRRPEAGEGLSFRSSCCSRGSNGCNGLDCKRCLVMMHGSSPESRAQVPRSLLLREILAHIQKCFFLRRELPRGRYFLESQWLRAFLAS